jgi:hypothetical protein
MQFLEKRKRQKMKIKIATGFIIFLIWWLFFAPYIRDNPEVFDPNGPSLKAIAYSDPIGALIALHVMHDTQMHANKLKLSGKKYEAFRHIYFSSRLTYFIGKHRTQLFTDAYERYNPNPTVYRDIDLAYNKIGRNFLGKNEKLTTQQLINKILIRIK